MIKNILIILILFPIGVLYSQNPDIAWIKSGHHYEHPMSDISRDGKFIVSLSYWTDEIKIWDVMSSSLVRQFKVSPPILCCIKSVRFSPNRKYIAVGIEARTIYLFDAENGNLLRTIMPTDGWNQWVKTIAFSPDSRYIVADVGMKIEIYEVESGNLYKAFGSTDDIHTQMTGCIFSPDGKYLLVGNANDTLQLWDILKEKIVRSQPFSAYYLNLAFSNDGTKYAASAEVVGDDVSVWDFQSGNLITKIDNYSSVSILFSADGKYLLCGQISGVAIHELPSGVLTRFLPCSGGYWISLSEDGKYLVASWLQVYLFDYKTGDLLRTYAEIRDNISSIAFSPSGKQLAYSSDNGVVGIVDCETGNIVASFAGPYPESVAYSPDGKTIAAAGRSMVLWDVGTEKVIYTHPEPDSSGAKIAFSPNGKFVAWGSDNRKITVLDVTTKQIYKRYYSESNINYIKFSPDSKILAYGIDEISSGLIDISSDMKVIKGEKLFSFSSNMRSLAVSSTASISFYNFTDLFGQWYALKSIMNAHYGTVRDIAYCFGDKYLASTSKGDSLIAIWDMNTYTKKYTFHESTYWPEFMAVSPNFKYIASAMGYERILILWKVPDYLTSVARNIAPEPGDFAINSIYPNPSSDKVSIDCTLPVSKFSNIKIFDLLGREVTTITASNSFTSENRITFNTSNLQNGTYFVRLSTGHKSVVQKFSVMK